MKSIVTAIVALVSIAPPQQTPVFKINRDLVSVDVSVKERNRPVLGLTATDFTVSDNEVPQKVESVSIEAVPVDVTLFLDTSGSTLGAHDAMARAVEKVRQMLRPGDRFRVLTIGLTVDTVVPWRGPEGELALKFVEIHGISLIFDATLAALAHTPAPGTRHLVIALTDGLDVCSVVSPEALKAAAERSEGLLHWIPMSGQQSQGHAAVGATCAEGRNRRSTGLWDAARVTGGESHAGWLRGADPVAAFAKVFSDFRQSYVLTYSPDGVPRHGWHKLRIEVPGRRVAVRARAGYFIE